MTEPSVPVLLDCTLRDGGYYNDWDFDRELVVEYLKATAAARIDVVEIGFRFPAMAGFSGPYAYSTDSFLSKLPLPEGPALGVMVNAADLLRSPGGPAAAIGRMFDERKSSPVELVRIAAHLGEAQACGPAVDALVAKGYRVGFNLMQSSLRKEEAVSAAALAVAGFEGVEVLYFADSLGNMAQGEVAGLAAVLRRHWHGPLGIHTHDNTGRALANSLAALGAGISWVDATVTGMGRGAGNARMEYLLMELARAGHDRYRPEALFPLVLGRFTPLQRRHGWGANLLYYLSAVNDIHPSYVQVMQADDRYRPDEIIAAMTHLAQGHGSSYSDEKLKGALAGVSAGAGDGGWSPAGLAQGRDVLLLAPGPGAHRHADGIRDFVATRRPLVLCLNAKGVLPPEMVDAYVTNGRRLIIESDLYRSQGRPVIAPAAALEGAETGIDLRDYGMTLGKGFEVRPTGCTVPHTLPAAYGLAVANAAGAGRVYLAGFDGFDASDHRQAVMMDVLAAYQGAGLAPMVALTPTNYPVRQSSVYEPVPIERGRN